MQMKPATDDEETGKAVVGLSGAIVGGAWGQMDRGTWETRDARNRRGSRTAHSSGEAGNDRGAKGLNRNMLL